MPYREVSLVTFLHHFLRIQREKEPISRSNSRAHLIFPGVGTMIDPTLSRADRMVGQVLGSVNALPEIFTELEISYFLLRRLLGVRTEGDKKGAKVQKLSKNEVLMVNIGSLSTGGRVLAVKADLAKISLTNPVCTEVGEKIALSRRVEKHWRSEISAPFN